MEESYQPLWVANLNTDFSAPLISSDPLILQFSALLSQPSLSTFNAFQLRCGMGARKKIVCALRVPQSLKGMVIIYITVAPSEAVLAYAICSFE